MKSLTIMVISLDNGDKIWNKNDNILSVFGLEWGCTRMVVKDDFLLTIFGRKKHAEVNSYSNIREYIVKYDFKSGTETEKPIIAVYTYY